MIRIETKSSKNLMLIGTAMMVVFIGTIIFMVSSITSLTLGDKNDQTQTTPNGTALENQPPVITNFTGKVVSDIKVENQILLNIFGTQGYQTISIDETKLAYVNGKKKKNNNFEFSCKSKKDEVLGDCEIK